MLTKLIRYEMKAFGRIILPLYAATIGMALIMGLGIRVLDEDVYSNILGALIIMIFTTLILVTIVMTGVLCVQRFYSNLLGNEGYLMFSLPVGTHHLIMAKVIGSLIWTFLGVVAGACTVMAMGMMAIPLSDLMDFFKRVGLNLRLMSFENGWGQVIVWMIIVILAFTDFLMQIYTAISIGHQWTNHRIMGGVLAFFGINTVQSIISRIITQIGKYTGLTGLIFSQAEEVSMSLWKLQGMTIVSEIVTIAIYGVITWYILDRRINLE